MERRKRLRGVLCVYASEEVLSSIRTVVAFGGEEKETERCVVCVCKWCVVNVCPTRVSVVPAYVRV